MQSRKHTQMHVRTHTVWLSGEKLLFYEPGLTACVQHFSTPSFSFPTPPHSSHYFLLSITSSSLIFVFLSNLPCHLCHVSLFLFYFFLSFDLIIFFSSFYFLLTSLLWSWFLDQLHIFLYIDYLFFAVMGPLYICFNFPTVATLNVNFPLQSLQALRVL